jgi:hypothetical protein
MRADVKGAWPLAARAQQSERIRRIAMLIGSSDDPQGQSWLTGFLQRLAELGWRRLESRDDWVVQTVQFKGPISFLRKAFLPSVPSNPSASGAFLCAPGVCEPAGGFLFFLPAANQHLLSEMISEPPVLRPAAPAFQNAQKTEPANQNREPE